MCNLTPADFILKMINEGLPYDESIKKLLILALKAQTYELRISSEVYLLSLPDAKELLKYYLDEPDKCLNMTINGEYHLLEKPELEDLLIWYIQTRPLEDEVQTELFNHKSAKKLVKLHLEKHGLSKQAVPLAKKRGWL